MRTGAGAEISATSVSAHISEGERVMNESDACLYCTVAYSQAGVVREAEKCVCVCVSMCT